MKLNRIRSKRVKNQKKLISTIARPEKPVREYLSRLRLSPEEKVLVIVRLRLAQLKMVIDTERKFRFTK